MDTSAARSRTRITEQKKRVFIRCFDRRVCFSLGGEATPRLLCVTVHAVVPKVAAYGAYRPRQGRTIGPSCGGREAAAASGRDGSLSSSSSSNAQGRAYEVRRFGRKAAESDGSRRRRRTPKGVAGLCPAAAFGRNAYEVRRFGRKAAEGALRVAGLRPACGGAATPSQTVLVVERRRARLRGAKGDRMVLLVVAVVVERPRARLRGAKGIKRLSSSSSAQGRAYTRCEAIRRFSSSSNAQGAPMRCERDQTVLRCRRTYIEESHRGEERERILHDY